MDTPPLPNGRIASKRVICIGLIWICFVLGLYTMARAGFPERSWEILNNWLFWNLLITAGFIGVDSFSKLTKP